MMSPDLAKRVKATIGITLANTAQPLPSELLTFGIATSMVVPPHARLGLMSRSINHIEDTLPSVKIPVYFLHGKADQIVRASSSKDAANATPNGKYVEIPGVGHSPSFEAPAAVENAIRSVIARSM
ncbi:MAG: alpha/beta hydrolase [Pseudomonadota bacterium]